VDAEQVLDGLNDEQRRAVTCPTTPLCILAGAGTGKTRVLTRRIAYRALTGDHDPNHVLALTFTRKAAGELSSRLARLGLRDHVAAGTFHGIAYAQLRARWADHGIRPPELLDRKVGFVARLLPSAQRSSALDVVTEIEWAKARDLEPDEYVTEVGQLGRRAPLAYREMAAVYERYEQEKQRQRRVDFDDLLRLCRRDLRRDREFAQAQHWRYQHLFVDEFQDVNPLQASLLDAWLGGRSDLCVVGDPNQAIYGWNGADPSAITRFAAHRPGAEVVRLTDNYRSSPQILAVANAVLAGAEADAGPEVLGSPAAPRADESSLRANRPDGPIPTVRSFPDDTSEARAIARSIRDHHRPGGSWSSQAVLCRTNAQVAVLEQALHGTGIPFRVRGGGGLLDQPEIKAALRDLGRRQGDLSPALTDLAAAARGGERSEDANEPDGRGQTDGDRGGDADAGGGLEGRADDRTANLEALVRLGHDYLAVESRPSIPGFLSWLSATTRADQPDDQGDAVELATFHAAKGLEWPVVHLAGLEQGLVPIGHARTDAELAEERRLFYVAITRAERELECTWAETRVFGERTANRTPSPYLDEVDAAATALAAGQVPADWVAHLAAQRAQLRRADTLARPKRSRRSARGGADGRAPAPDLASLDPAGLVALDALKDWRGQQARAASVPAYVIFHDRVLIELVTRRPATHDELLAVSGIGEVKVARFGDDLLEILAEHAAP
jgi:DNA helicase II / ATP-dependent DNA helicase PcrA